ncbi:hypothetical protein LINGRAHAP2_LOCUS32069 [Linum grandiflorum]
MYCNATINSL